MLKKLILFLIVFLVPLLAADYYFQQVASPVNDSVQMTKGDTRKESEKLPSE